MTRLLCVMTFVAACSSPGPSRDLYPPTAIDGFVSDAESGEPIVGAKISAGIEGGTAVEATTNGGGVFQIVDGIKADQLHAVRATHPAYEPNQVSVTPALDKVIRADLVMTKKRPLLEVTPSTVEFGNDLDEATIRVENVADAAVTLSWEIISPAPWILPPIPSAGVIEGKGGADVKVKVDRAALGSVWGDYSALVAVAGNGGFAFVEVRMRHDNPVAPVLEYDQSQLEFGLDLPTLPLKVRNTGTGTLIWSAPAEPSWVTVVPASGAVSRGEEATVQIGVARGRLAPGADADGFLALVSNSTLDVAVPVRVHARVPDVLQWSASTINVDMGFQTSAQDVAIRNEGSKALDFTTNSGGPWLAAVPPTGHLGPGENARVQVQVKRDEAAIKGIPFQSTLTVQTAEVGLAPIVIAVKGDNTPSPILETNATIGVTLNGAKTATTSMFVHNAGGASMSWRITSTDPWLSFTPSSGTLAGTGLSCSQTSGICGVSVQATVDGASFVAAGEKLGLAKVEVVGTGQSAAVQVVVDVPAFHFTGESVTLPPEFATQAIVGLVFDSNRDRLLVLTNAYDGSVTAQGAWSYDNTTWTKLTTTGAPTQPVHSAVYDPRRRVVTTAAFGLSGVWDFADTTWTRVSAPAPFVLDLGWDARSGRVMALADDASPYAAALDLDFFDGSWHREAPDAVTVGDNAAAQLISGIDEAWALVVAGYYDRRGPAYTISRNAQGTWTSVASAKPLAEAQFVDPSDGALFAIGTFNTAGCAGSGLRRVDAATRRCRMYPYPGGLTNRYVDMVAVDPKRRRALALVRECTPALGCRPTKLDTIALRTPGASTAAPVLAVDKVFLDLGANLPEAEATFRNTGAGRLVVSGFPLPNGFKATPDWANLGAGESKTIRVGVDRSLLPAGGVNVAWNIASNGGNSVVTLKASK